MKIEGEVAKQICDKIYDLHYQERINKRNPLKNRKLKEELKQLKHELLLMIKEERRKIK